LIHSPDERWGRLPLGRSRGAAGRGRDHSICAPRIVIPHDQPREARRQPAQRPQEHRAEVPRGEGAVGPKCRDPRVDRRAGRPHRCVSRDARRVGRRPSPQGDRRADPDRAGVSRGVEPSAVRSLRGCHRRHAGPRRGRVARAGRGGSGRGGRSAAPRRAGLGVERGRRRGRAGCGVCSARRRGRRGPGRRVAPVGRRRGVAPGAVGRPRPLPQKAGRLGLGAGPGRRPPARPSPRNGRRSPTDRAAPAEAGRVEIGVVVLGLPGGAGRCDQGGRCPEARAGRPRGDPVRRPSRARPCRGEAAGGAGPLREGEAGEADASGAEGAGRRGPRRGGGSGDVRRVAVALALPAIRHGRQPRPAPVDHRPGEVPGEGRRRGSGRGAALPRGR